MYSNKSKLLHPSPLRYPGGKAKLSSFLGKVLDKKDSKKIVFVEPYAGGAGAALSLLFAGKVSKIVINDLDPAIFSFWKAAVFETDRFIRKIQGINLTVAEWQRQHAIYKNKSSSEFNLGFATFFLNRTNRSGIIEGGPIGGIDQKGEWKINARFNKEGLIERLKVLKKFRKKIVVTNLDGIDLLRSLEKKLNASDHFIFLDPPYINKGKLLYLNHYLKENHESLAAFLKDSGLEWVMTYDDTQYIRKLYSTKEVKGFSISHTAYTRKKGKEVLISPRPIRTRVAVG